MSRVVFPPAAHHLEMPARGRRAQRSSLALFAATSPRQRVALGLMRGLIATRTAGVLRGRAVEPPVPDWNGWLAREAVPRVGPVSDVAWYVGRADRLAGLLLGPDGAPAAFVKLHWGSWYPGTDEAAASAALRAGPPPRTFAVAEQLATGFVGAVRWELDTVLPEGPHRRPPDDPPRLRGVFDELAARLSLAAPAGTPAGFVLTHADLTPRNLRLCADGRLWLLDWEGACWGPPHADEVTYWLVDFATRLGHRPERDAGRVLDRLAPRMDRPALQTTLRWLDDHLGDDESAPLRAAVAARAG